MSMQVQNGLAGAVARAYGAQTGRAAGSASPRAGRVDSSAPRTDSIAVSSTLQEVARLGTAVAAAPDARADRVAALKAAVTDGTYSVDTKALAAALLAQ